MGGASFRSHLSLQFFAKPLCCRGILRRRSCRLPEKNNHQIAKNSSFIIIFLFIVSFICNVFFFVFVFGVLRSCLHFCFLSLMALAPLLKLSTFLFFHRFTNDHQQPRKTVFYFANVTFIDEVFGFSLFSWFPLSFRADVTGETDRGKRVGDWEIETNEFFHGINLHMIMFSIEFRRQRLI